MKRFYEQSAEVLNVCSNKWRKREGKTVIFLLKSTRIVTEQVSVLTKFLENAAPPVDLPEAPVCGAKIMQIFNNVREDSDASEWTSDEAPEWSQLTDEFVNEFLEHWNLESRAAILKDVEQFVNPQELVYMEDGSLDHDSETFLYFVCHYFLARTLYGTLTIPEGESDMYSEIKDFLLQTLQENFEDPIRMLKNREILLECAIVHLLLQWRDPEIPKEILEFKREIEGLEALCTYDEDDTDDFKWKQRYHMNYLAAHWFALLEKYRLFILWHSARTLKAAGPLPDNGGDEYCVQRGLGQVVNDETVKQIQEFADEDFTLRCTPDGCEYLSSRRKVEKDLDGLGRMVLERVLKGPVWAKVKERFPNAELIPDECYLRMKVKGSGTPLHADFYHFRAVGTMIRKDQEEAEEEAKEESEEDQGESKEDQGESKEDQDDSEPCAVCKRKNSEELLVCDRCECGVHPWCAKPPVHINNDYDWYCEECEKKPFGIYTVWVPLTQAKEGSSVLLVSPGSSSATGFQDGLTEDAQVPRGWLENPGPILSADLNLGDLIAFSVKTVHGATQHLGDEPRVSFDFRIRV